MPLSVAETLQRIEESRQQRIVWQYVVDYLSRCVDMPEREAQQGIPAAGCINKTVPQNVIIEAIQGIEAEKISPLDEEISALENLKVVETKNEPAERTAPKKKANKAGVRILAGGPGRQG